MECINVLVCKLNFMFYDDRHWLLALLATGSVMPFFFTLVWLTTEGSWGGWLGGMTPVRPSSLINDWFVLVRLFHSSCKLDCTQILR